MADLNAFGSAESPDAPLDGFDGLDGLEDLEAALERADRAERALARLQGSFTMTVGRLVVDAGQSPRRLIALPFALLRMRRSRRQLRGRRAARPVRSFTPHLRDASLTHHAERMLVPRRALTTDTRPSLVVIGPPAFRESLAGSAHVSAAQPHDATALVRALDPDAVLIHAHAGRPGSPWAPLGEPGEAVREAVLVDVREACRRLGRPVVLLADPLTSPGLVAFAAICDRVIDVDDDDRVLTLIADLLDGPDA